MPNGRKIASRKLLSKVTGATATDDAGTAFAEIEEAEAVGGEQAAAAKAEAEGEDRGATQPAGKANQCQPGA